MKEGHKSANTQNNRTQKKKEMKIRKIYEEIWRMN